jgi:hypothetical protein
MGGLPDVRGLNGTDLFENTKILIGLEKRASQFNGPGGDLSPRHHIKWPRAKFATKPLGALGAGMPHTLGRLKMGDDGAISSFLTGFTQVHVRKDKKN